MAAIAQAVCRCGSADEFSSRHDEPPHFEVASVAAADALAAVRLVAVPVVIDVDCDLTRHFHSSEPVPPHKTLAATPHFCGWKMACL